MSQPSNITYKMTLESTFKYFFKSTKARIKVTEDIALTDIPHKDHFHCTLRTLASELAVVFPGGLVAADHAFNVLSLVRRGGTALRRRGLTRRSRRQKLIFPPAAAEAELQRREVGASRRA